MKLDILRVKRLLEDIKKLIYHDEIIIDTFKILDSKSPEAYSDSSESWRDFSTDENWLAKDQHRWFRTTIRLSNSYENETVIFRIITGREGQWDACNPQFLFYVNKKLVQGCDVNHREVIITDSASLGETFDIDFLSYGGTEGEDLVIKCSVLIQDKETEALYYDIKNPIESAELIYEKDVHNRLQILKGLDPVMDCLDLREPYSASYYQSVKQCRKLLKEAFYTTMNHGPVVYAIGNTHIDIAWLWTVEQTREKVIRSYSTVIELMNRYPEYKFIGSQAILYQFVKEQNIELYQKIKEKIEIGQWEVDGGMWLEADCNIPSGESLIRQFTKGEQFFESEFGKRSTTLWLPDVFGYSAALPQILKLFDIPYFVTTKIAWNQYNQLPNDMFNWRGLDGSEVFTFMPTTSDFNKNLGNNISFTDTRNTTTYTGILAPNMTLGTYERFQNKNLTEDTLMLYGYGDGGGGPTREMLENEKRLKYGLPGIPRIETSFNSDFMKRTQAQLKKSVKIPTWDGELYFEYHRGTLTSNASVKRWNRKIELLVRKLEILTTFNYIRYNTAIPHKTIDDIWDTLLLNQFHDIVPGTSIAAVYEIAEKEYNLAFTQGSRAIEDAIHMNLKESIDSVTVFNDLPYHNTDVVTVDAVPGVVALKDGTTIIPVQHTCNGKMIFVAKDVPMLSFKEYTFLMGEPSMACCSKSSDDFSFENKYYKVKINQRGEIESLVEKKTGFDISGTEVMNQLIAYEDRPANWDNWDVDIFYQRKPYPFELIESLKIVEIGVVRVTLEVVLKMVNSTLKQKIHLYHELPRIDFEHKVDWYENNLLLRAVFPTTIYQNKATFDIQFGSVERETSNNHSWDAAKFETCAHKWVDLGNNGVGLSLLNDSKYGFSVKENTMGISLIKSGKYPNAVVDIRKHNYVYALYPHAKRWHDAQTIEEAESLNSPMLGIVGQALLDDETMVEILSGECFIDTIKMTEKGHQIVLRVHEHKNSYSNVTIKVSEKFSKASIVNLREELLKEIPIIDQKIAFNLTPFEIKTFTLTLKES